MVSGEWRVASGEWRVVRVKKKTPARMQVRTGVECFKSVRLNCQRCG